nr:ORF3 [Torque teno felis virus]
MHYGDRCHVTSCLEGWYQKPPDQTLLKPKALIRKNFNPKVPLISGGATSTPMDSSKDELLRELLNLIHQISDADFRSRSSDLNLSLQSLETSSESEVSSDDWEITPPTPPLKRGGKKKVSFKYTPFCKKHAFECEPHDQ